MGHDEYTTNFDQTIRTQHKLESKSTRAFENSDIPEILHVLAKGGMATIFEAKQRVPPRIVAVKQAEQIHDEELQQSLYHEAMIMGGLDHPNIIPIHQIVIEGNRPSVIMKRVQGKTFKEFIHDGCSVLDSINIILQVSHAVEYAHQRGIIHRDIKPSNIMIGHYNEVYLLDWGIAIDQRNIRHAMSGLVGSPSFMAPEMLCGDPEQVTEQTDIYLLGSTLHYALTKTRRHDAESFSTLFSLIESSPAITYPPEIPVEVASLLNQTCHKDPNERPISVHDFRKQLTDIRNHWKAIQLAMEGGKLAQKCVHVDILEEKEVLFHKARQDFSYAQRIWPESEMAVQGHENLLRHMLSWYIAQKHPRKAHQIYMELDIHDNEIINQITELFEGDTFLNEEQLRLLRIGQAYDFVQTKETSATFSQFIGFGAIFMALCGNIVQFVYRIPLDNQTLWYSALAMMGLVVFLMYSRYDAWKNNRSMERMCIAALGTIIFISLNRFMAMMTDVDPNQVLTTDCFAIGLGTLMVSQIVSYGYVIPCICAAIGTVSIFHPTMALPCLSLITLIVPFGMWWAWKQR